MNLLKDKRDDERHAEPTAFAPVSSEDVTSDAESMPKETGYEEKRPVQNSRTALFIIALVVLAVVVIYFSFFKPREGAVVSESEPPVAMSDSAKDTTATVPVAEETPTAETEVSAEITDLTDQSSLAVASLIMQTIQNSLTSGQRVTAFFLDEGSFSTEVEANSLEDAKAIYRTIQQSLPALTKLTSSAPVNGLTALLSGTFTPTVTAVGNGWTRDEIKKLLEETARTANTAVTSLSIDGSTDEQKFVFMKIEGAFDNCRVFIDKLSQTNMKVSVSKLILMPASAGRYTFVLRFYI
ncbi:hypothetical protein EH223_18145 [candidate division KSB1 bacterium]|nr:hypothetical protein [candidate division KSB1 bacterium]RQW00666.1 MAG: hypothetical protein EH223_18145 [candidate division KSB1 bacterium]